MSDTTTAAAADFSTVRDFPDRISPMVVKELRQGLRGRYFVGTAIGFHALVCIILATSVQDEQGGGMLRFVWVLFTGVMVFLLPVRGLSALADERTANTLDTLVLTNLTAGRILRGKWLAIASQITLLAVSILPYVILMYLAKGTALPLTLTALFRLWMTGLLMSAVMVSISWNQAWLLRTGMALMAFILAIRGPLQGIFGDMLGAPSLGDIVFSSAEFFWLVTAEALTALTTGFVLLEITAGKIAPHENHSGPARLAALALLILMLPLSLIPDSAPALSRLSLHTSWILAAVCLFGMTEPVPDRPSFLKKVPRWLPFGQGWRQGAAFAVIAWALVLGLLACFGHTWEQSPQRLAAWLFCGWALMRVLPETWRLRPQTLVGMGLFFIILQVGLRLLGSLLSAKEKTEAAAAWVPAPMLMLGNNGSEVPSWILAWGSLLITLAFLLLSTAATFFRKTTRPDDFNHDPGSTGPSA